MKKSAKIYIELLVAVAFYLIFSNMAPPPGLSENGWKALLLMICCVYTWVTEFIPIGISSCFLLFLPGFLGIEKTPTVLSNFGIATMFFVMASLIIAKVFISSGLGYRISLYITPLFGAKSNMVLLSIMLCGCLISSVLVDIPTAIILAGIALPLLKESGCEPGKSKYGKAVMIGIPISAALGGIATPAGSGLNILTINLLNNVAGKNITFLQWTAIGFPMAIVLVLIAWFVITLVFKPEIETVKGLDDIKAKRREIGPMTTNEKKFLVIFIIVMVLWFTQSMTGIETAFASLLAVCVFFLPGMDLMDWKTAKDAISWESVLLIESANAIAMILSTQGTAEWISNSILGSVEGASLIVLLMVVTAFGIFSHLLVPVANAVLAVCVPIVTVLATSIGVNPLYLVLPLGFTASAVFIIPLDPIPLTTYGYGYWKLGEMAKPGIIISLIWIPVCALFMLLGKSIGII